MALEIRFEEFHYRYVEHFDHGSIQHYNVHFKIELFLIFAGNQQFPINYSCLKIKMEIPCVKEYYKKYRINNLRKTLQDNRYLVEISIVSN